MRRSSRGSSETWHILAVMSFIAVLLLGLALMLGVIFSRTGGGGNFANWIERIAIGIAIIVPIIMSGYFAISQWRSGKKSGVVWFVLWIIALVLVVVFYVWGFWRVW